MSNIVAIIDPFSSGKLIAPKLRKQGLDVVAIISSLDALATYGGTFVESDFSNIYYFNGNVNALMNQISGLSIKNFIPGTESGVTLADKLANIFSPEIANDYSCIRARRDKMEMVEALKTHGLRTIKSIKSNNLAVVERWLACNPEISKLVVKPLDSGGTDSVGIFAVNECWKDHANSMLGFKNKLGSINETILFQEYIQGVEYVVDSFSWAGQHYIKNICRYTKIKNGIHEAVYASMLFLDNKFSNYSSLVEYTYGVLNALGIKYGPAHSEVIIDEKGPVLVETGARLHGGGHPIYAEMCTGQSQLTDLIYAYAKGGTQFSDFKYLKHVKIIFIIANSEGILNNSYCMEQLGTLSNSIDIKLTKAPGDHVFETSDLFSILGFVVLSGDNFSSISSDEVKIRKWEKNLVDKKPAQ